MYVGVCSSIIIWSCGRAPTSTVRRQTHGLV